MRRLHLAMGVLALVGFVLSGQYMDRVHAHLVGMPDGPRLLYRSAHIYLLFAALLNLLLGAYLRLAPQRGARLLQQVASLTLLALPALFAVAFFREPALEGLERPWARPAIYLGLAAVLAHVLAQGMASGRATMPGALDERATPGPDVPPPVAPPASMVGPRPAPASNGLTAAERAG
jgi:hypothetical protein